VSHDNDGSPDDHDGVFAALANACGTARACGNLSAVRVLEAMLDAQCEGWMGDLAQLVEMHRRPCPADRAMVEAAQGFAVPDDDRPW
jgi:hypothetical protein